MNRPAQPASLADAAKKKLEPAVTVRGPSSVGPGASVSLSSTGASWPVQRRRKHGRASQPYTPQFESASDAPNAEAAPSPAAPALTLTAENAVEIWNRVLARLSGMVVEHARQFETVAFSAPHRLVVRFKAGYDLCKKCVDAPSRSPASNRCWPR